MTTHAPASPKAGEVTAFKLFRTEVGRVSRLSPHLKRITFVGPELCGMTSGGLDQRIKLLLPQPGQDEPCLPEHERSFPALRALPDELRPKMRTYTIREHRPRDGEFDVDFVLHGDTGPGSSFAGAARPGDRVGVFAPNLEYSHGPRLGGVEYKLDLLEDRTLIVGDETALPAIGGIMNALPPHARATVFVEIPDHSDAQHLHTAAEAEIHWVERSGSTGVALLSAVQQAHLPGRCYSWVAGEAGMVKSVRRHLVGERRYDRDSVTFMGYWRCGQSEDAPAVRS